MTDEEQDEKEAVLKEIDELDDRNTSLDAVIGLANRAAAALKVQDQYIDRQHGEELRWMQRLDDTSKQLTDTIDTHNALFSEYEKVVAALAIELAKQTTRAQEAEDTISDLRHERSTRD